MTIDRRRARQLRLPSHSLTVDRDRLRTFATAIGETDPIYFDAAAAQRAGHRDIPVLPTLFFSMEMDGVDAFGYLTALGVDLRTVLHAEQAFDYHTLAYAGDTLRLSSRIIDVYHKNGGALEFVVKRTEFTRSAEPIAVSTSTMAVRHRLELAR